MRIRRSFALVLSAFMLAGVVQASAADPYPIIEEPELRPDSQWTKTDWGYIRADLESSLPPADPPNKPGWKWPTVFTMEGYAGATRPTPNAYVRMDDGALMAVLVRFGQGPRGDYAFVQASIRGTECSAGHFNLYDKRHAWDAHHIIEWIADQGWSNDSVGMFGSSFPGQTAYWTAVTQPPSLKAVSANLLHSDIYRDIFMPGGVQNVLFPSVWTYGTGVVAGPHRVPADAVRQGAIPGDEICTQHQASRYGVGDHPHPENEPAWAATRSVDDQWYIAHAALTYADSIKIPYYMQNNWQDEQVGPRSIVLFNHINPDPVEIVNSDDERVTIVPKKFVNASGDHGHGGYAGRDRWAFFDIFLLGMPDTTGLMDDKVVNYYEAAGNGAATATTSGDSWPFEQTSWEKIYLEADGGIGFDAPDAPDGDRTYLSGVPARQNFSSYTGTLGGQAATAQGLPDMLTYISEPLDEDLVIAGPILMDLYASVLGSDADLFVSVNEAWEDGSVSYLQRGLLKASHRRVDPLRSYYVDTEEQGRIMVQPYRPHTNPELLRPGAIEHYQLEIFPLGHIFRAGNRIQINVHTPPIVDGLWGYTATHHQPAPVTIHHGSQYPTSIQLPVVPTDQAEYGDGPGCQIPAGFPCYGAPIVVG